jgi:hypothetical protein
MRVFRLFIIFYYCLTKKILVVRVSSGLCNRLQVLLCAIAYSETTNRKLLIHWQPTTHFNVSLRQLFDHPYPEIGKTVYSIFIKLAGKVYDHNEIKLNLNNKILIVSTVKTFCTDGFPQSLISYLARLKPIEAIRDKTDAFYNEKLAGKKIIGIQLRYNKAHSKTLENSPPRWFIHRINEIHRHFPHFEFFLSTDCREMSELLHSKIKAVIHEVPKTYQYNQPEGVTEAVCDLYLLARTKYILMSYWSTLSLMAGWMRGENAFEHALSMKNMSQLKKYLK